VNGGNPKLSGIEDTTIKIREVVYKSHFFNLQGNNYLEKVVLYNCTRIQSFMFMECNNLKDIEVYDSNIKSIGNEAFYNTSFTSFTIWPTVVEIEYHAFRNCKKLEEITFSSTTKIFGAYVFEGCSNLKRVNFNGTLEEWLSIEFDENIDYLKTALIYINGELIDEKYLYIA